MSHASPVLGVLGGMGPLATADFMRKLVEATPAAQDQDHMPVFVHSVPQIPDRSAAYLAGSDAPWPYLLAGLRTLETVGADAIAIPCNTAHLWYPRLSEATRLEVLHIGKATSSAVTSHPNGLKRVGLMATSATIQGRIYHEALEAAGVEIICPTADDQSGLVMAGIAAVKGADLAKAKSLLKASAAHLINEGADGIILGCTELPLVLSGNDFNVPLFDTTHLLVKACVSWWRKSQTAKSASEICSNE